MDNRKRNNRKPKPWEKKESRDMKRDAVRDRKDDVKYGVFHVSEENDASWWCKDPVLTKNAANLSYSWATGVYTYPKTYVELPTVMSFGTVHGPGVSLDNVSPINNAARRMYADIRKANSGAKNYGPQDLIQYFCAMDEAYAYLATMTKLYGLLGVYSSINRALPKAIFKSMNVDFKSFEDNMADFRTKINLYTHKINAFKVPKAISLFERHMQIYGNVYFDANDARATVYSFRPRGFRFYDEANGKLSWFDFINEATLGDVTFDDVCKFADKIINAITASESFSIMSGDIEKAYGGNVINVSRMADDYVLTPVYSEEVLTQIHNAVIAGYVDEGDTASLDITQNAASDTLLFDPILTTQCVGGNTAWEAQALAKLGNVMNTPYVDLPKGEPTPELNMVATRLMPVFGAVTQSAAGTFKYHLKSSGTEFLTGCTFTVPSRTGDGEYQNVAGPRTYMAIRGVATGWAAVAEFARYWSMCDWGPKLCIITSNNSTDMDPATEGYYGDITRMAYVSPNVLTNIHEVALLSVFLTPALS